jgi:DNA-directed RNA polymerase specialized sigma24 family protein
MNINEQFDVLYREYVDRTRWIQAKVLHNRDLVDESQQELWAGVWIHLQKHNAIPNPDLYLASAARNAALHVRSGRAKTTSVVTSLSTSGVKQHNGKADDAPAVINYRIDPDLLECALLYRRSVTKRENQAVASY